MPGQTKNIGQVAAIWIAVTAPSNTKLVWYDTSSSVHRVYDTALGQWVALNPQVITSASIASLRSIATGSGLPIGKYYTLTDTGTIAIAITSTKIWYVDTHNNYVVNDLAAASQYYINSTNLMIDGSIGVWDTTNGQLKFEFSEITAADDMNASNDYFVMRRKSGNVWSWAKSKLSNFVSLVTGNSLTWNNGLYFNFNSAINNIKDRQGGICSTQRHNEDMDNLRQQVNNTSLENQQYLLQAREYTDQQTASENIYAKQLPSLLNIPTNPSAAPSVGWQLKTILQQIYGWINKLKLGNNINIGSNFNIAGRGGDLNANDSVMSALEKLVFKIKNAYGSNILLHNGTSTTEVTEYPRDPQTGVPSIKYGDNIFDAIRKLLSNISNSTYAGQNIMQTTPGGEVPINTPVPEYTDYTPIYYGDSVFVAIRKILYKLSHLNDVVGQTVINYLDVQSTEGSGQSAAFKVTLEGNNLFFSMDAWAYELGPYTSGSPTVIATAELPDYMQQFPNMEHVIYSHPIWHHTDGDAGNEVSNGYINFYIVIYTNHGTRYISIRAQLDDRYACQYTTGNTVDLYNKKIILMTHTPLIRSLRLPLSSNNTIASHYNNE